MIKLTKQKLKEIIRDELMNEATYNDTPKNRKLKRVGKPYNTRRGTGNRGGGTKFPQARPKGGPVKPMTTKQNARKNKYPGTDPDKHTTITRKHAGDRMNLNRKLKSAGGDYANTAMSWDEFDDIPDITDLISKKKKTNESLKLTKSRLKEIIKEELQNLNELQTFPPFEIAKRMLKNKKFGDKWAKQIIRKFRGRGVSEKSLNKFLSGKFSKKDIDAIWSAQFEGKIKEKALKTNPKIWVSDKFDKVIDKLPFAKLTKDNVIKLAKKFKIDKDDALRWVSYNQDVDFGLKEGKLTEVKKVKYKKNDWKKYNKLVQKGKSVMVQTAHGDNFAWEEGSRDGVFATENNGREIELSHDDIVQVEIF